MSSFTEKVRMLGQETRKPAQGFSGSSHRPQRPLFEADTLQKSVWVGLPAQEVGHLSEQVDTVAHF